MRRYAAGESAVSKVRPSKKYEVTTLHKIRDKPQGSAIEDRAITPVDEPTQRAQIEDKYKGDRGWNASDEEDEQEPQEQSRAHIADTYKSDPRWKG
eukprot:COSAG01_NODE_25897_length_729_cov_96.706349_1_plen_96_part_00